FHGSLRRISDVVYLFIAAIVSTAAGAAIATLTHHLLWNSGITDAWHKSFVGWWFGGTVSDIALAPVLLVWHTHRPRWSGWTDSVAEILAVSICLGLSCEIAFGRWFPFITPGHPLAFLPFPFVMWAAVRFGLVGASLASFVSTIWGVVGIVRGQSFVIYSDKFYELFSLQFALATTIAATALITAAAVSERRQSDQGRRRSQRQLNAIFNALPDVLLVLDRNGNYLQVFTGQEDLLVAPPDALIGRHVSESMSPAESAMALRTIQQVVDTGEPLNTEYSLTFGEETRWFSGRVVPFGKPDEPCVLWAARDISDLVVARQQMESDEQLMRNLLALQEEDKRHFAHKIHDGLVQYLVGSKMTLDAVSDGRDIGQAEVQQQMEWSRELIARSIAEARQMISDLRPLILDEQGIVLAIQYLVDAQSDDGTDVQFYHDVSFERLPSLLEGTLFRIAQEALENVRQHSRATRASIGLVQMGEMIRLEIEDNGIGFDPETIQPHHFGVGGIVRRAELFGGRALIDTSSDDGTRISVTLPMNVPDIKVLAGQG
ncbi:MAG: MASE1 domain-containing protein, partial [Planctomycetales bacterium]|nr:MASE1 domain-containing protein [Planctomycetales bacterium]